MSSSDSHASYLTAMLSTASVQFSAAAKGWRSDDSSSCLDESSHRWVPARTPTVHRCPNSGEAVGGPTSNLVSSGSSTDAETKSYLTVFFFFPPRLAWLTRGADWRSLAMAQLWPCGSLAESFPVQTHGRLTKLRQTGVTYFGHDLFWPRPTLATTDFGHDRLWPTAFPTLATTYFGHDLFWPRPTLATTYFGHDRLWPRLRWLDQIWPTLLSQRIDLPKCPKMQNRKTKRKKRNQKRYDKGGTINIVRVCVKASPAEGRRRFHTNTAYARLSGFNRPSCGASPAEGRRCST